MCLVQLGSAGYAIRLSAAGVAPTQIIAIDSCLAHVDKEQEVVDVSPVQYNLKKKVESVEHIQHEILKSILGVARIRLYLIAFMQSNRILFD